MIVGSSCKLGSKSSTDNITFNHGVEGSGPSALTNQINTYTKF
jgi:hypothetical protein